MFTDLLSKKIFQTSILPLPYERISPYFKISSGEFTISEIPIKNILKTVDSDYPFYLYDANTIKFMYQTLKAYLPENFHIYYAVKANPSMAVVQYLDSLGSSFDIASIGELQLCQHLGINPQKISYTAPVKTRDALESAITLGVYIIIDSLEEAMLISKIAKKLNKLTYLGIRINPPFQVESNALHISGGTSSKFGTDFAAIPSIINKIKTLDNIQVNGIHIFAASNVVDTDSLITYYENCFILADKLKRYFQIDILDFGGGLGIPYTVSDSSLDLQAIGDNLHKLIKKYKQLNIKKFILEPGRFLVGNSGIYITKIEYLKESFNKSILLVNGGIHQLSGPALRKKPNPIHNITNIDSTNKSRYDIAGPLCLSADYFGKNFILSTCSSGDMLGIFNSGAYGYSQSNLFFLSHTTPKEYFLHNNNLHCIRKEIRPKYILENQFKISL